MVDYFFFEDPLSPFELYLGLYSNPLQIFLLSHCQPRSPGKNSAALIGLAPLEYPAFGVGAVEFGELNDCGLLASLLD